MSMIEVRKATIADTSAILKFITDLAIYEKAEHEVKTDEAKIHETIFSDDAVAKALMCEVDGNAVGFAIYFYSYSTWLGKKGLYLEDLYVDPEFRGHGAGKALFQNLAQIALENDCARFEWRVLDWNEPAIKFYESMGAEVQSEWVGYRLAGEALDKVASLNNEQG